MGSVDIFILAANRPCLLLHIKQILVYRSFYRICSSPWKQYRARPHPKRWNIYNQYFNGCTVNVCSLLSWSQYIKIIKVYKYVDLWFIWDFLHVIPTFYKLFQRSPCYSNVPHVIPTFSMLFQLSDMLFQLSACHSKFQTCYSNFQTCYSNIQICNSNFLYAILIFRHVISIFRHVIPTFRHVISIFSMYF